MLKMKKMLKLLHYYLYKKFEQKNGGEINTDNKCEHVFNFVTGLKLFKVTLTLPDTYNPSHLNLALIYLCIYIYICLFIVTCFTWKF